jgi:sulfatase modifying factor 1
MKRDRMTRDACVLGVHGLLVGSLACGAATGLDILEDVPGGVDGGRPDATTDGTTPEARTLDAPLLPETEDSQAPDAAPDIAEEDVAPDSPTCSASSDSGAEPPSCTPGGAGMTNCGASEQSCCTSTLVCGATYFRSYSNPGTGAVRQAHPATVTSFRLDLYEVTVGRFRQYVQAWNDGYTPPAGSGKHAHLNGGQGLANSARSGTYETGWLTTDNGRVAPTDANLACSGSSGTWTPAPGPNENRPIDCTNWWESYAFCIWDGGFLPSEAEWEYAAAGGSELREYPWGSTDPGKASQYAIYACLYPPASGMCTEGVGNLAPVGTATLGAGLWGQLDLAGNSFERTADWFAPYMDPCVDCAHLSPFKYEGTIARMIRGGSLFDPTSFLRASDRDGLDPPTPDGRGYGVGMRCARAP